MLKDSIRPAAALILCLAFGWPAALHAQIGQSREARAKVIMWADWDCFTSRYPKAKLAQAVKSAIRRAGYSGVKTWGDRAFAYDLNGDRAPEYIIPLICAGVGNCAWGVFALNPAGLLGFVYGQNIYIRRRVGRWAALTVYTHESSSAGYLDTYLFKNGGYVKLPGEDYVHYYDPYPRFMKMASPCRGKVNMRK